MTFFTKYLTIQNTTSVMLRMLIPVNSPNVPPIISNTENDDKENYNYGNFHKGGKCGKS